MKCAKLILLALFVAASCKSKSSSSGAAPSTSAAPALAPLSADSWLVDLDVPGFDRAKVAVPLGAREPRPVVIAIHGGADRPEWQCGTWTGITRAWPFVLCPRGVENPAFPASNPRFGWGTEAEVEKELRAALKALKARFGKHVSSAPVVMAAFSSGVKPATAIIMQEPSFFTRAVLVGPGPEVWNAGLAGAFVANGGRRLLWVCTDPGCRADAERYFVVTRGARADTKLLEPGDFGRVLDPRVASAIEHELPWLVGDAPAWPEKM